MEQLHNGDPESIGAYRVIGLLGSGGMGRVYLCTSPGGRRLAVKVIRPELADDPLFRARFRREVKAAQLVRSHVTAAVVDADTESPTPWLATVFLDGPTLSAAVEQSPMAEPELRRLAAALAEALQFIHGAGLVHRDLKPSNIILAPDGPRVIDFGIARAADATALTTTNLRIGSPGYMAPEQIRADATGPGSDMFALGAVLAYAATGRSPFGSGPTDVVLYRVLHEEPDLDDIPHSLRSLIAACLSKDPGQRPTPEYIIQESMGDSVTLVLTQTASGEPVRPETSNAATSPVGVAATSVGTQVAPQPEDMLARRSRHGVSALIAVAVALLVAGTAWATQSWRSPASAPSSGPLASASTRALSTAAVASPAATTSTSSSTPKRSKPTPQTTTAQLRSRPQPYRFDPAAFVCKPNHQPEVQGVWQIDTAGGQARAGDAVGLGLRSKFGGFPETIKYQEPLTVDVRVYLPDGSSRLAHTSISSDKWATVIWPGDFAGADPLYQPGTYTVVWTEGLGANRYISCDGFVAH